jgi:hypothetical protein
MMICESQETTLQWLAGHWLANLVIDIGVIHLVGSVRDHDQRLMRFHDMVRCKLTTNFTWKPK